MKKLLKLTFLFILGLVFITSCSEDDSETVNTFAKVTVKQKGQLKVGKTVYMFTEDKGPNTSFFKPSHSDKSIITESNGVATFKLQEAFDLDIVDSQTTLYFGVFDSDNNVLGNTAISIEKGQTKNASINY